MSSSNSAALAAWAADATAAAGAAGPGPDTYHCRSNSQEALSPIAGRVHSPALPLEENAGFVSSPQPSTQCSYDLAPTSHRATHQPRSLASPGAPEVSSYCPPLRDPTAVAGGWGNGGAPTGNSSQQQHGQYAAGAAAAAAQDCGFANSAEGVDDVLMDFLDDLMGEVPAVEVEGPYGRVYESRVERVLAGDQGGPSCGCGCSNAPYGVGTATAPAISGGNGWYQQHDGRHSMEPGRDSYHPGGYPSMDLGPYAGTLHQMQQYEHQQPQQRMPSPMPRPPQQQQQQYRVSASSSRNQPAPSSMPQSYSCYPDLQSGPSPAVSALSYSPGSSNGAALGRNATAPSPLGPISLLPLGPPPSAAAGLTAPVSPGPLAAPRMLPLVASDCIDPCVRPVGQQGRLLSPAAYDMLMAQRSQYVGGGALADQQKQRQAAYRNVQKGGINMQPPARRPLLPFGYRGDFGGQQGLMPASSAPGDITHLDGHSGYTIGSGLSARSFFRVGAAHYAQEEVKFTATGLPPHQLQSPFTGYTGAPGYTGGGGDSYQLMLTGAPANINISMQAQLPSMDSYSRFQSSPVTHPRSSTPAEAAATAVITSPNTYHAAAAAADALSPMYSTQQQECGNATYTPLGASSCYLPALAKMECDAMAGGDDQDMRHALLPLLGGSCTLDASCVKFSEEKDQDHLLGFGDLLMPCPEESDLLDY